MFWKKYALFDFVYVVSDYPSPMIHKFFEKRIYVLALSVSKFIPSFLNNLYVLTLFASKYVYFLSRIFFTIFYLTIETKITFFYFLFLFYFRT